MTNKKTAAYCVLLAAVVFAGALFISVGETQARYSDAIYVNTVVGPEKAEVSSDFLVKTGEPPVSVLLGKIERTKTLGIPVTSTGSVTERLSWEATDDISVSFSIGEETIENGAEITVNPEGGTLISMKIVPIAGAVKTPEPNVEVFFGELSGTFLVELPEVTVEAEDIFGGEADKVETVSEEPAETEEENTGDETGETTEDVAGETAGTTQSPAEGTIDLLPNFDPKGKLPMRVDIKNSPSYMKIGFYDGEKLLPLPKGTRISIDQGANYFMIPEEGNPEFKTENIHILKEYYVFLLDFSKAEIVSEGAITVAIETYSDGEKNGIYTGQSVPDVSGAGIARLETGVSELEIAEGEEAEIYEEPDYFVLSEGDSIMISFPKKWKEYAGSTYSIQALVKMENGKVGYSNVDSGEKYFGVFYSGDETGDLLIKAGENLPPAGKYQITVEWKFNEICFFEKQITFFINYLANTYSTFEEQGGAAE